MHRCRIANINTRRACGMQRLIALQYMRVINCSLISREIELLLVCRITALVLNFIKRNITEEHLSLPLSLPNQ